MLEHFDIFKSAFTLIVSILSSYFILREKVNRVVQKNKEQSKEIERMRLNLKVIYDKKELLMTKIIETSFAVEEYKTTIEKLEKRLERIENERTSYKGA